MPELPARPDLNQLRRQARELLRAAATGEASAVARLRAVSDRVTLSSAQLAIARDYGFLVPNPGPSAITRPSMIAVRRANSSRHNQPGMSANCARSGRHNSTGTPFRRGHFGLSRRHQIQCTTRSALSAHEQLDIQSLNSLRQGILRYCL